MINPEKEAFEVEYWLACDKQSYVRDVYPKMIQLFGLDKVGSILEVGTGPLGGILPYVSSPRKVGLDPAYVRYKEEGLLVEFDDIQYVLGFAESTHPDEKFDTIVAINSLDHGDSSFDSIDNLSSMLEPGGKMFLHVHLRQPHELNIGHDHALKEADFFAAVKRNHLKILRCDIFETDPLDEKYKTLVAVLQNENN
jgi:cyclopropane fatty-acyl-phospholipid synthase-like methyltransferase